MINQLLIEELFMSPLCIETNYAQALAMSAYYAYSGKQPLSNTKYVKSYTINASTGIQQKESTPGSVGLVTIDGPIVSASDPWYGIKGTIEAGQELLALDADPNIIGTVLFLESGGGAVYALKPIIDVLNSLDKPVVTYTKQILASAAYRIGANTDYIMMYHPQGIVGSLGTMYSGSDIQPMLEKWGMKFFEYYASESTLKNKTFTDAKNGDGAALINNILNPMNDLFLGDIQALRGHKIDSKDKTVYKGETYLADPKAIALGLIDSLGTIQDAVAMVVSISNGDSPSSINSNFKSQNNMFGNKFKSLSALAGVAAASITANQVEAVNKQIEEEKIEGVTLALDSELEIASKAAAENTAALASINKVLGAGNQKANLGEAVAALVALKGGSSESTTALTTINAELGTEGAKATLPEAITAYKAKNVAALQTLTTDRDSWKAKAIEYGVKPADEQTAGVKTGQETVQDADKVNAHYSDADAELEATRKKFNIKKPAATK